MSERRFKFVSPGVFIKEIDQSQLPDTPVPVGPVVIGRSERGPGMRPVTVTSFSQFVETFGEPFSQESARDAWRDGGKAGTAYGAYAAKAWLRNNGSLTFIRLLGKQDPDASSTSDRAGWKSEEALGLFLFGSSSNGSHTGTLAAILYREDGATIQLSGTAADYETDPNQLNATLIDALAGTSARDAEFKLVIEGEVARASDGSTTGSYVFNFNPNSKKYIRNVLNTDAIRTNSNIYSNTSTTYKKYFLGETFEESLDSISGTSYMGVIVKLASTGSGAESGENFQFPSQKAETGWFIAQDLNENTASYDPEDMQKLFRLRARDGGKWVQDNLKISITNMRYGRISGSYGSFDLVLRKLDDTDNTVEVVERFSNCNLDPSSPNYLARKVGDRRVIYDNVRRISRDLGQYDNQSKFVYVEMKEEVEAGTTPTELLPFGVFGPIRYENANYLSSSNDFTDVLGSAVTPFIAGSGSVSGGPQGALTTQKILTGPNAELRFNFPQVPLRAANTDGGGLDPTSVFYGAYTGKTTSNAQFAEDILDIIRPRPRSLLADPNSEENSAANEVDGLTEFSWVFSLDDVSASFSGNRVQQSSYAAGNRVAGASVTSKAASSYKTLIDRGVAQFTTVLNGGSDGFTIKEKEPILREGLLSANSSDNYAYYSVQRAIDLLSDPEQISFNLATVPGLKNAGLTKRLVERCEDRGDALAIIDIEKAFVPPPERTATQAAAPNANDTIGDVEDAVETFIDRQLDSSFGCAYYPWVQALDDESSKIVYLPPSVVALGVMSKTDFDRGPWFAPAGFTRGGLSSDATGIPVLSATEKLTSKDRDKLYEVGINPIATFPNEGVVVFGQKTLQADRSALDRINVRRMLIYVKQGLSQIASNFLFEPNVQDTWNRFLSEANPFLLDVQQQFGIDEYRLILDENTTTPDLIDQNILYAKLFIKPTRAIEFIAVDFFITNSGASFED
jgi:hypothetical protein